MNKRQIALIIKISLVTSGVVIPLLWINDKITESIVNSISASFLFIIPIVATLSMALYVYVDSLINKFPELYAKYNAGKIDKAFQSFSKLKTEIIANIILLLVLLTIDKALEASSLFVYSESSGFTAARSLLLALRSSCVSVSFFAMVTQIKAMNTTNEYRIVLANNEKGKMRQPDA